MRKTTTIWTATWALIFGAWISLAGDCFGQELERRQASSPAPIFTSERAVGEKQDGGQSNRPANPPSDVDEHVRHHAALGVLLSKTDGGVSIVGVIPGSPAALAGLRMGDEIRYVGDERVRTTQGLTEQIREYQPASQVELSIRRNGERRIVTATLASQETTFGRERKTDRMASNRNDSAQASKSGRSGGATNLADQRIRLLQQEIVRLQQEVDQLMSYQGAQRAARERMRSDDWGWNGHQDHDDDPALFQ